MGGMLIDTLGHMHVGISLPFGEEARRLIEKSEMYLKRDERARPNRDGDRFGCGINTDRAAGAARNRPYSRCCDVRNDALVPSHCGIDAAASIRHLYQPPE